MRFTVSLILYGALYATELVSATGSKGCNADNCLRAVRASAFPTRSGTSDCSSYFSTTVQEKTSLSTVAPGVTTKVIYTETTIPTDIPQYASACSGSVRYSSACSCISVQPVTTTLPPGPPVCYEGEISCDGRTCQDALSDPNNCGGCGNVCPSGICQNGQCSVPSCNGSSCGSLNSCGANCFCFKGSSGTGFCGPNTACAPLADCTSDSECSFGEVCATSTCCGRNVCLGSCAATKFKRSMLLGRSSVDAGEQYTGGKTPSRL